MEYNVFIELLDRITPGWSSAALPVIGPAGGIVVEAGATIGVRELDALKRLEIDKVFVEAPASPSADRLQAAAWMPHGDWLRLVGAMRTVYNEAAAGRFAKAELEGAIGAVVRHAVSGRPALPLPYRTLPSELQLFGHAVNTAVWAAHAAVRLGHPEDELTDAVAGCLLHDIGKVLAGSYDGHQTAAYLYLRRRFPPLSRVPGIVLLYPNALRAAARRLGQDRTGLEAARLCYVCNLFDRLSEVSAYRYEGALDILRTLPDRSLVAREAAALSAFAEGCMHGGTKRAAAAGWGAYWTN